MSWDGLMIAHDALEGGGIYHPVVKRDPRRLRLKPVSRVVHEVRIDQLPILVWE